MPRMNKEQWNDGRWKEPRQSLHSERYGILSGMWRGADEAKESLQEVVDFLNNPGSKYPPHRSEAAERSFLLLGPPGPVKHFWQGVAGERHMCRFSLSGSEFVEMFVGVGASRVRDLFEEARRMHHVSFY